MGDCMDRIDAEIAKATAAGDKPVMLHLAEDVYRSLRMELMAVPSLKRIALGSVSVDPTVAVLFRHLPCRQYEELPAGWIMVIRDSTHTRTLMGLPWERVLVPETSKGQAWVDRNKRRRRR